MIKCKGYYTEPQEEVDLKYYEKLGIPLPDIKSPSMIETNCWIDCKGIQAIFDTKDGKCVIYYENGWDVLIKYESKVIDQLI
jgi:hypothetical protein